MLNFMELLGELIINECLLCKCERVSDCNNNVKVKLSKCGALKRDILLDLSVTNA